MISWLIDWWDIYPVIQSQSKHSAYKKIFFNSLLSIFPTLCSMTNTIFICLKHWWCSCHSVAVERSKNALKSAWSCWRQPETAFLFPCPFHLSINLGFKSIYSFYSHLCIKFIIWNIFRFLVPCLYIQPLSFMDSSLSILFVC